MRPRLVLLLAATAVAVALPTAPAQAPSPNDAVPIVVEVEDFPYPAVPLGTPAVTNVTVTVPCAALLNAAPGARQTAVELSVTGAPAWVVPALSPATLYASTNGCVGRTDVVLDAQVVASATAEAPAFEPGVIVVDASVTGPLGTMNGSGSGLVAAGFFSIIERHVERPVRIVEPESATTFPVTFVNRGNGDTRVTFTVENVTEGWTVPTPPPLTLGRGGAGDARAVASLVVQAPAENGFNHGVGTVVLAFRSAYASDEAVRGDDGSFSVILTAKGFHVPSPAVALALTAVAVGASLTRGRSR